MERPVISFGRLETMTNNFVSTKEQKRGLCLSTLDRAGEVVLWVGRDGEICYVNKAGESELGYPLGELQDLKIGWVAPELAGEQWESHWQDLRKNDHCTWEMRFHRKNGSTFPVEISAVAVEIENHLCACLFARDITRRVELERELKEALDEVEHLKDRLEAENVYLKEEIDTSHNFAEIITRSPVFHQILRQVEKVAATSTTVLIQGETGTGKELMARAIHTISDRHHRPLVKVNCAALPANLIESELFGHEKGAFTGAIQKRVGRFELAHQGTIFLDEVGDLPFQLQSKLLRVLQEGEFERLGNPQTIPVDVRVLAATNRDLEKMVEEGQFREDLFYRLHVFPITLPPLRDRREDIPLLVDHFVKKFSREVGKEIETVPPSEMDRLSEYHWPGNVRELENVVERAVILSPGPQLVLRDWVSSPSSGKADGDEFPQLDEVNRRYIIEVLEHVGWKVSGKEGAARILGLKPTTLEARMKKLGIERPE